MVIPVWFRLIEVSFPLLQSHERVTRAIARGAAYAIVRRATASRPYAAGIVPPPIAGNVTSRMGGPVQQC